MNHLPFPSQRQPLIAENGVVATSQPLAAQAGLQMLQQGGNAVDAAVATAVALTVLEPTSNGIGGDAFALVWDGDTLHGLNGSGRAPAAIDSAKLRDQGQREMESSGWSVVTVPGAPSAWWDLHERFGRLPFADVLAPAIRYARDGYAVTPVIAWNWRAAVDKYSKIADPAVQHWMPTFASQGRAPYAGERWASPGHAYTLQTIAEQGLQAFYEGELAEKIIAFSEATNGLFVADDLANHQSEWVDPIRVNYRGYDVWEIPPNGQGLTALIALGILDGTALPSYGHVSGEAWHLQIEAMKLAFADARRYIGDQQHVDVPVNGLLDPAYLAERRALISDRARVPEPGTPPGGGTVYLCAADRDGMMVSYIQSNYGGFGSGVVVPDTGIALHNRGEGFSLVEGHPNEVKGGKRPYHTIIPGFLTRDGQAVGPFGVMGGFMQPQGHAQVVTGTINDGLNPQAVLDAPRWRVTSGLNVDVELGTPEHIIRDLIARGHQVRIPPVHEPFGRGQIIWRTEAGFYAAGSEPRADGMAVGW